MTFVVIRVRLNGMPEISTDFSESNMVKVPIYRHGNATINEMEQKFKVEYPKVTSDEKFEITLRTKVKQPLASNSSQ